MHSKKWSQIDGLSVDHCPWTCVRRDVLEITRYYTLLGPERIRGPFDSYVEYILSRIRKYIYAYIHLAQNADMLNNVQLRLAHKDLHFGNIRFW